MACNVNLVRTEYLSVSQTITIVPRLDYSSDLLKDIVDVLKQKKTEIRRLNRSFLELNDEQSYTTTLDFERTLSFSIEILTQIQKRIRSISGINSIPLLLPLTIPMIRTVSAQLFNLLPICSQKLSELSVHLGSIILDSAFLTDARFDFSQSNVESSSVLNEVKLMIDSKISKQYPNLDFFKQCNT